MNLDILTIVFMIAIESISQSLILVCLVVTANRYQGISTYALGTVFFSVAFAGFFVYNHVPFPLLVRLVNNSFVALSTILYAIGIGQFFGHKSRYFPWVFLFTLFLLSQAYLIYIFDDYFWRNASLVIMTSIAYIDGFWHLLRAESSDFEFTTKALTGIFFSGVVISVVRLALLVHTPTNSIRDGTVANLVTFLLILILDYLRNGFFTLMVSQRMYADLHHASSQDFLTQTLNRRAIVQRIERFFAQRQSQLLSLILLDIDYFKKINDTYGHDVGDLILQAVARSLSQQLQKTELLGRWGGEEFLIFLPQFNHRMAQQLAEQCRQQIEQLVVRGAGQHITCTVSLGVVTAWTRDKTYPEMLKAADMALYAS